MQTEDKCPYGYTFGIDHGKGGNLMTNIGELPDTSVCDLGCAPYIWENCKRARHDVFRLSKSATHKS